MDPALKSAAQSSLVGFVVAIAGLLVGIWHWSTKLNDLQPGTYKTWYVQSLAASMLMLYAIFLVIVVLIGAASIGKVSVTIIKRRRAATITSRRK